MGSQQSGARCLTKQLSIGTGEVISTHKAKMNGHLLNGMTPQLLPQVRVSQHVPHLLQTNTTHQGNRSTTKHFTTTHCECCLGGEQRLTHRTQRDGRRTRSRVCPQDPYRQVFSSPSWSPFCKKSFSVSATSRISSDALTCSLG